MAKDPGDGEGMKNDGVALVVAAEKEMGSA